MRRIEVRTVMQCNLSTLAAFFSYEKGCSNRGVMGLGKVARCRNST